MYTQFTEPVRHKKAIYHLLFFFTGKHGPNQKLRWRRAFCVKLNGFNKLTILNGKTSVERFSLTKDDLRFSNSYTEALRYCAF